LKSLAIASALFCSCATGASAATPESTLLEKLAKAEECSERHSSPSIWCLALDGFARAQTGKISPGVHKALGLTVEMTDRASAQFAVARTVRLSALVLRNENGRLVGDVSDVGPSNQEERVLGERAALSVGRALLDPERPAQIDAPLAEFMASLGGTKFSFEPVARGWRMTGRTNGELRKVGPLWVAMERPVQKGDAGEMVWFSLFTEAIEVKPAPPAEQELARLLADLNASVGCPGAHGGDATWCIVSDGYPAGHAEELSPGDHVLFGLALELGVDRNLKEATHAPALVYAGFRREKGHVVAFFAPVPEADSHRG
jgi:hypothetical protein